MLLLLMIHTFTVLSLQLKKLRRHNQQVVSHRPIKCQSRSFVVTKRYEEGQRVTSWGQLASQTNRDPNRDKTLARSNHPRATETYRRQYHVFGYKLQFLLSGVLPVFQNLNYYKLQRRLTCVRITMFTVFRHTFPLWTVWLLGRLTCVQIFLKTPCFVDG